MGIFDFLKRKSPTDSFLAEMEASIENMKKQDYLGFAAQLTPKIQEAIDNNNYDLAWGLSHEKKELYIKHANKCNFTEEQVYALDSSVHKTLANILRLEGKHQDALVHILYWAIGHRNSNTESLLKVVSPYFNRCKFKNSKILAIREFLEMNHARADIVTAKEKVQELLQKEPAS